jgi:hypothetical protein
VIGTVKITLTGELDFASLIKRGWAHPKNPSNAYQDTLVKEVAGSDVWIVQRGEECQVGVFTYDLGGAIKVLKELEKELR